MGLQGPLEYNWIAGVLFELGPQKALFPHGNSAFRAPIWGTLRGYP